MLNHLSNSQLTSTTSFNTEALVVTVNGRRDGEGLRWASCRARRWVNNRAARDPLEVRVRNYTLPFDAEARTVTVSIRNRTSYAHYHDAD